MKNKGIILSAVILIFQLTFSFLNAQNGGNRPPCDEPTENKVDCIARFYLGNDNTKDLQLKSVRKGYAGHYVKYDKVVSGIRIFEAETVVILKDDLSLNALYPDTLNVRGVIGKPVMTFTREHAEQKLLSTRIDIVSLQPLRTFWINPAGDWLVAHAFLAYIPSQQNHSLFFVDAGNLTIYEREGKHDYIKISNKKMEGQVNKRGE